MVKMSDVARIMLDGMDDKVDHDSPLVEQAALVYEAARRLAIAQNFKRIMYLNQYPGYEGPMVMKRLVIDLFPLASRERIDAISSSVGQVMRRSVAAVCTTKPGPRDRGGSSPIWFIADSAPENMADIAAGAETLNHHRPNDRLSYVERKLTPHEAGEDREPPEITVKRTKPVEEKTTLRTEDEIAEFDSTIYEEVATSSVPITVTELTEITGLQRWVVNRAVKRLEKTGRLFSRLETDAERTVRTEGKGLPRAKRPHLWWPSEPIPVRTALPQGATPQRTSAEWADDLREINKGDEERILRYLDHPPSGQRSTGKVARAVGLEHHRTKRLLDALVDRGELRVSKPAGLYYLASDPQRRPGVKQGKPATPPPVTGAAPVTEAATAIERIVAEMVEARVQAVQDELERVTAERDDLKIKLDRLKAALLS